MSEIKEMTVKRVHFGDKIKLFKNSEGHWENHSEPNQLPYKYSAVERLIETGSWVVLNASGEEDLINKPEHYHSGGIDVIAFAEAQCTHEELRGFYKINVWKYTARAEKKNGLEDYMKAEFYQNKLLELLKFDDRNK